MFGLQRVGAATRRKWPRDVAQAPVGPDLVVVLPPGHTLDTPSGGETVAREVHGLHRTNGLEPVVTVRVPIVAIFHSALAHRPNGFAVKPVHALAMDAREFRTQQVVDTPVAKVPMQQGDLNELVAQSTAA